MKKAEKKLYGNKAGHLMKTDIKELEDGYELEIDLPGFKKEEVQATLEDGYLTISAEKGLDQDEQEKKTGRYIRRERYAGACSRSFYVGDAVSEEDIKGDFHHGIPDPVCTEEGRQLRRLRRTSTFRSKADEALKPKGFRMKIRASNDAGCEYPL